MAKVNQTQKEPLQKFFSTEALLRSIYLKGVQDGRAQIQVPAMELLKTFYSLSPDEQSSILHKILMSSLITGTNHIRSKGATGKCRQSEKPGRKPQGRVSSSKQNQKKMVHGVIRAL